MESKKLLQVFRAVYNMILKGIISRRKLMLDLQLLLKRTKLAGKAIFSSKFTDPNASAYHPQEVEFSCSNTPLYPANKRKNSRAAAAAMSRVFEMPNMESWDVHQSVEKGSPMKARRIRVTDSPFPAREEVAADGDGVDAQAEDFIRRFYEQLKLQQRAYY